jgi:hypothetical protein
MAASMASALEGTGRRGIGPRATVLFHTLCTFCVDLGNSTEVPVTGCR